MNVQVCTIGPFRGVAENMDLEASPEMVSDQIMITCGNYVKVATQASHLATRSKGNSSFQSIPSHKVSQYNIFLTLNTVEYNPNGS
jgi:hypothetical protein